ncbi:DUF979 domain-containing protein [Anaerosalibacter bizertensis]|uniref:DUF979 domain-containing protein n=1 Tax=Anaerosalibacter bizertensis TaxID=932217 RepID=A0A9Q4ACA7_9FIRM|nr:DUF979 domain-containing protein [Anaerosalibacter bizertensis]MCG4564975.1 DUF979 domain-containing protein [Anaerosalibacter bizertensis]HHV26984.1 DUF979 domain-containing protein [Tissierellia bacterium]
MALEFLYILAGIVSLLTSIYAFKDKELKTRFGTGLFWLLLAITFILGELIPAKLVGIIVLIMGTLTATGQVKVGNFKETTSEFKEKKSKEFGNKIFIPVLSIAFFAFVIGQFTSLGGLVGLGIGAIVATISGLIITKAKTKEALYEGNRLLQQVGPFSILPQLLAALGALFNAAGVGEVIASGISKAIPADNIIFGSIAYCLGMAVFTMIMGNGFAAFTVITAGIGIPFVYNQGADPAIAGALALTAGYCGTLLTPMAANFNIVPAAVLEMEDKNKVIKTQAPIAILMLVIHIILMIVWAF